MPPRTLRGQRPQALLGLVVFEGRVDVEMILDDALALAGPLAEAGEIEDGDLAAVAVDQPLISEHDGSAGDGGLPTMSARNSWDRRKEFLWTWSAVISSQRASLCSR